MSETFLQLAIPTMEEQQLEITFIESTEPIYSLEERIAICDELAQMALSDEIEESEKVIFSQIRSYLPEFYETY
ncbi:hypothetical protein KBC51_01700 [Candidatus Saccharibacteria bacterium]|nr:hypothetical protein [Candidatus Saccharibacteria bacterium]MCA9350694.1 hypothetical protein [Candidatus Saccharibacteria bacterium]